MTRDKKTLALTMGDPAGCGPAISGMAWQALRDTPDAAFFLIAPPDILPLDIPRQTIESPNEAADVFGSHLPILPIAPQLPQVTPGAPRDEYAPAIIASIEAAVSFAHAGQAGGVVTNPISKAVLYEAGFKHPGHTEFIAELCSDDRPPLKPVMMLVGGGLRVALATIHMPLIEAAQAITQPLLIETARIVDAALKQDFGLARPRIAFTGLNPHAGEGGALGSEEADIINPAAAALRDEGISITDARPGDTVFAEALSGAFDAVIAMTHDQGLIPVKTLDMWGGVNTTLGLPIIRTSPDHGTAFDAAAAGTLRADSLIAAIRLAADMRAARASADV